MQVDMDRYVEFIGQDTDLAQGFVGDRIGGMRCKGIGDQ